MSARVERPARDVAYWAPVVIWNASPLVFGERHGAVVDTPSQDVAVVYSTRERAAAALRDPSRWSPRNVAHVRLARVVWTVAGPRWADDGERDAHVAAYRAHQAALAGGAA